MPRSSSLTSRSIVGRAYQVIQWPTQAKPLRPVREDDATAPAIEDALCALLLTLGVVDETVDSHDDGDEPTDRDEVQQEIF
jgi:hypothetical protein